MPDADASQRRRLVQSDVIGLSLLISYLGVVLAAVMSITFVVQVFRVHFHNLAADPASLRAPDYAIADLESLFHPGSPVRGKPQRQLAKTNSSSPHTFPGGPDVNFG